MNYATAKLSFTSAMHPSTASASSHSPHHAHTQSNPVIPQHPFAHLDRKHSYNVQNNMNMNMNMNMNINGTPTPSKSTARHNAVLLSNHDDSDQEHHHDNQHVDD